MNDRQGPEAIARGVMTNEQRKAFETAQRAIEADITMLTAELTTALGLEDSEATPFVAAMNDNLDSLTMTQKRELLSSLGTIRNVVASNVAGRIIVAETTHVESSDRDLNEQVDDSDDDQVSDEPNEQADSDTETETETKNVNIDDLPEIIELRKNERLTKYHRQVLKRFGLRDELEHLSSPEFLAAMESLLTAYENTPIPRLSTEAKQKRAEQWRRKLRGEDVNLFATDFGVNPRSIDQGISKMPDSLIKRYSDEEIRYFLDLGLNSFYGELIHSQQSEVTFQHPAGEGENQDDEAEQQDQDSENETENKGLETAESTKDDGIFSEANSGNPNLEQDEEWSIAEKMLTDVIEEWAEFLKLSDADKLIFHEFLNPRREGDIEIEGETTARIEAVVGDFLVDIKLQAEKAIKDTQELGEDELTVVYNTLGLKDFDVHSQHTIYESIYASIKTLDEYVDIVTSAFGKILNIRKSVLTETNGFD